jgi:hypothetical protein
LCCVGCVLKRPEGTKLEEGKGGITF